MAKLLEKLWLRVLYEIFCFLKITPKVTPSVFYLIVSLGKNTKLANSYVAIIEDYTLILGLVIL